MTKKKKLLAMVLILLPFSTQAALFCPLSSRERPRKPRHAPLPFIAPPASPACCNLLPPPPPQPIVDDSGYLGRRAPQAAPARWRPAAPAKR